MNNLPSIVFTPMKPVTVVFDMIGTCFSLDEPRQRLAALGAPDLALTLWFAQTLRDAFALSHAGGYRPLQEVLTAELPRTLKLLDVEATPTQMSDLVSSFSELAPQPDALASFQALAQAGIEIVALTNGSQQSTRKLLERAECLTYFSRICSADTVKKTKPHPDVYGMLSPIEGDVWMIAAHAWDIAGAIRAGFKTAFITQTEREYLAVYPAPAMSAQNLSDAVAKILATLGDRAS